MENQKITSQITPPLNSIYLPNNYTILASEFLGPFFFINIKNIVFYLIFSYYVFLKYGNKKDKYNKAY